MTDDDLPVLTDVIRAGTVRRAAAMDERFATDPRDAGPAEVPNVTAPLVIGDQPHQAISAYLEPTGPDVEGADTAAASEARSGDGSDAGVRHTRDAFSLPQDHDGGAMARPSALDVPALDAAMPAVAAPPGEDAAVLARRIRDAVIDDLRTRIDTELDARIAQVLHVEVETVLAQLQQSLRAHLADALRDVVARAVDEAIAGRRDGPAPVA